MRTQGEIEAAISVAIARFEQDYMGRGPKDIRAHLITDFLVIRLHGVLTAAEQQLVNSLPAVKGRELLKQVRSQLMEAARPTLEAMVQEVTGATLRDLRGLANSSLLERTPGGRYVLHELLRQYAEEKLNATADGASGRPA